MDKKRSGMKRLNLPPIPREAGDNWDSGYENGMLRRSRQIAKALRRRAEWFRRQDWRTEDDQHESKECDFLASEIDPEVD